MAAGATINGVGDIAWTFGCNNGDQLSISTKCYYAPNANTILLSPQKLLDKRNGQTGKYWGDQDMFHLKYDHQHSIDVPYSPESNLPIGYAVITLKEESTQINQHKSVLSVKWRNAIESQQEAKYKNRILL